MKEIKGDVDNHNKIVNSTKEMISTLMKAKTELSENDVLKQLQVNLKICFIR